MPRRPGGGDSLCRECRDAALHEMVHAYNYMINPHMPLWLGEGVALYLSNGDPPENLYNIMPVPSFEGIQTCNPIVFANIGGYDFAYTYVEYLDAAYGWDKVLELMRTGGHEEALGISARDAYSEWAEWLRMNYS